MALCRWTRFLSTVPWFVDRPHVPQTFIPKPATNSPISDRAPQIIKLLHSQLLHSPHLDKSALSVGPAVPPPPGPPLPKVLPHGRRNRGGTFSGESVYDMPNEGLWSWVVVAQVKEGTENRGAIESVVRVVRKTLLGHEPPFLLPPKSRRQTGTGWVMIDAGSFAVHILSKDAREKYFNNNHQTEW